MGPTLVSYMFGAGAGAVETVVATMAVAAASMVGALWLAAGAVIGGCAVVAVSVGGCAATATAAATVSGPGLDQPAGGGEEWRTRGLKLCSPCVLTMPRPEKGRIWREWEEEDLFAKEEKGF